MNEPNRFLFSIEVYDNKTKKKIAYDSGNCSEITYAKKVLNEAIEALDKFELRELDMCPECATPLREDENGKMITCDGCGYLES